MKKNKITRSVLLVVIILFVSAISFSFYKLVTEKLPTVEINRASESLAKAKNNEATKYAVEKLNDAEEFYEKAMKEWARQNERFFWFRDFSETKSLANQSVQLSSDAKQQSVDERKNFEKQIIAHIKIAEKSIERFESTFKNLPLNRATFDLFNKGKMEYLEAKNDFNNNNLLKASQLIEKANNKLQNAENSARGKVDQFYKNLPEWIKHARHAEQLSKTGQTVVLINKMQSNCSVLKSGKTIKKFDVEFGPNWMGDKIMKGDRSTPEGIYKITEKKKGIRTKYYKALLINYPNKDDQSRFDKLKRNGTIPKSAQIGGLIEIHGEGGKGIHWTDGCIALKNKDMDQLFDLCSTGTTVVIIGSDNDLQ